MQEIALDRFTGFSELYNDVRPKPPTLLTNLLIDISRKSSFDLVIDLGSGTGLSTVIWKTVAKKIIGIEPNEDMRKQAIQNIKGVHFESGSSYQIPLNKNSADLVCCSQSFHWMKPESTLNEVNRVLVEEGFFVVYDCNWPITISPKSEMAYINLFTEVDRIRDKYKSQIPNEKKWPKSEHKKNIKISGYFDYVKETYIQNVEKCDAQRFIGLALSQGHIQTLIKNKIEEINLPLEKFIKEVEEDIEKEKNMYISYEVLICRKKMS